MPQGEIGPLKLDSQAIEILGRNALVNSLLAAGIEVARPERDRGIDLLAYVDTDIESGRFSAAPIQMKASQSATFSLSRKYERFPELLMAYVWNVGDADNAEIYAMTYANARAIAQAAGWLETASWTEKGHYVTTKPSVDLRAVLEGHRATPERWKALIGQRRSQMPGARTVRGNMSLGEVFEVDGVRYVVTTVFIDGAIGVPEGTS